MAFKTHHQKINLTVLFSKLNARQKRIPFFKKMNTKQKNDMRAKGRTATEAREHMGRRARQRPYGNSGW